MIPLDPLIPQDSNNIGNNLFRNKKVWVLILLGAILVAVVLILIIRIQKTDQATDQELPATALFGALPEGTNPFLGGSVKPLSCDELPSPESEDACRQSQALESGNIAFCSSIKTLTPFVSKDTCHNLLAQKTKNSKLCAQITNPAIKKNCLENTK